MAASYESVFLMVNIIPSDKYDKSGQAKMSRHLFRIKTGIWRDVSCSRQAPFHSLHVHSVWPFRFNTKSSAIYSGICVHLPYPPTFSHHRSSPQENANPKQRENERSNRTDFGQILIHTQSAVSSNSKSHSIFDLCCWWLVVIGVAIVMVIWYRLVPLRLAAVGLPMAELAVIYRYIMQMRKNGEIWEKKIE